MPVIGAAVMAEAGFGDDGGAVSRCGVPGCSTSGRRVKVIQASQIFQPKDEIPTTVVDEGAGGVTPQDLASVTGQIAKFNALGPVASPCVGPIPSRDKNAIRLRCRSTREAPAGDNSPQR
jgi:hypothetical protein